MTTESNKKTIFIWDNNEEQSGDRHGIALCEDGVVLAEHVSSSLDWLKHDMGLTSEWKHEAYRTHCPQGYQLVFVDQHMVASHEALNVAYKLSRLAHPNFG